jgi:hypothetical protein
MQTSTVPAMLIRVTKRRKIFEKAILAPLLYHQPYKSEPPGFMHMLMKQQRTIRKM